MNSTEVRELVLAQIGDQWERSNLHRCDLRACLVEPPTKISLVHVKDETQTEGWLVLREAPSGGYGVVFHEESGKFGLTQFASGYEPCLLGLYGRFFDAFDAM